MDLHSLKRRMVGIIIKIIILSVLRRSVGVGMRFFLPMFGLLGFDYGIGLDRIQPGQGLKDASRFTFMLGFEPE